MLFKNHSHTVAIDNYFWIFFSYESLFTFLLSLSEQQTAGLKCVSREELTVCKGRRVEQRWSRGPRLEYAGMPQGQMDTRTPLREHREKCSRGKWIQGCPWGRQILDASGADAQLAAQNP